MPLRPPEVPPPPVRVRIGGEIVAERADDWREWRIRLPRAVWQDETVVVELEVAPWTLRDAGVADDDRERGIALSAARLVGLGLETRLPVVPWQRLRITEHSLAEAAHALDSYGMLLANSRFTQEWIARRWERESTVLYPSVDLAPLASEPAGKWREILSVGRFFAGAHNKQHLPMIAAFKALCDAGLQGWTYHLVGGCDLDQPAQRAYLEQVQAAAAGYPIRLHVNAPLAELRRRYAAASLFWHAAGFGVDVAAEPEAVEHFGITTIEAMAAGCVPVVIAKAGQLETVIPDASGLLWSTLDELQAQTRRLIADPALLHQLAAGAVQRSRDFDFDVFARRVAEILEH
jgi:glycosyltransferase involved in cell wall biosynthesis